MKMKVAVCRDDDPALSSHLRALQRNIMLKCQSRSNPACEIFAEFLFFNGIFLYVAAVLAEIRRFLYWH